MEQTLKDDLEKILKGKIVILGLGNPLKGDDAAGMIFVEKIEGLDKFECVKGGLFPENYTGEVISKKPDTLIIIDAININGSPGDIVLLKPEQLKDESFASHGTPISVLIKYLSNFIKDNIYIIGIQPKVVSFGNQLSVEVSESVDMLEEIFTDISKLNN